jgi:hypothetical protein
MSLEGFACSRKSIGVWTRSYWNNIGECYSVVVKESPIIIIFYFMFSHRWENGNCHSASEEHLRNLKTSRYS